MEPITEPLEKRDTEEVFEFHNNWPVIDQMGFELFSIRWIDDMFAFVNALQIVILNFEFRFFFKKVNSQK